MTDQEHGHRYVSAMEALAAAGVDDPEEETGFVDLLTNLMHYAESNEFDFKRCLKLAENHFRYETERPHQRMDALYLRYYNEV